MIPKKADINDMIPCKNRKQQGAGTNGGMLGEGRKEGDQSG